MTSKRAFNCCALLMGLIASGCGTFAPPAEEVPPGESFPSAAQVSPVHAAPLISEPTSRQFLEQLLGAAALLSEQARQHDQPEIAVVFDFHCREIQCALHRELPAQTAREFLRQAIDQNTALGQKLQQAGDLTNAARCQAHVDMFVDLLQQHDDAHADGGKWSQIRFRFPTSMVASYLSAAVARGERIDVPPSTGDATLDHIAAMGAKAEQLYREGMASARKSAKGAGGERGFTESLIDSGMEAVEAIMHPERFSPAEREKKLKRFGGYGRVVEYQHGDTLYRQRKNGIDRLEQERRELRRLWSDEMDDWERFHGTGGGGLVR